MSDERDDGFDPYGGEEENEVHLHSSEDPNEEASHDPDDEEEEVREREPPGKKGDEDPEYEVWHPNDPIHQGSNEQHAIITCSTSAGPLLMHFHRSWSPHGYERATSLFERHYYDHSHLFRVVPHFLVQFGIGYTKDAELRKFSQSSIPDDPKRSDLLPFREGMMSFAGSGPNSRSSQLFIAYDKAQSLGTSAWETPFGEVVGKESLETVRSFYQGYGDMPPWGKGPQQGPIHHQGSSYIEENFPLLDKFITCKVKRVAEIPKEGADAESVANGNGSVRKAGGLKENGAKNSNALDTKEQLPLVKLLLLLGGAVAVILGLGLRRRNKNKVGKNV